MTPAPPRHGTLHIRVRYDECDPMGLAHHSAYPAWFEMGRTELYRQTGKSYRDLEAHGIFLAVASLKIEYRSPARYDDELVLETTLTRVGHVKMEHEYRLLRDGLLLTTGHTKLACMNREWRPTPLPEIFGSATGGSTA